MKNLLRIFALAAIVVARTLRVWAAVLGLSTLIGMHSAIFVIAALVLCNWMLPLRVAAVVGAVAVWHWPLLLALAFAAPRLVLILPGLVSTWLASRRHPRPRWDGYDPRGWSVRGGEPVR